jgi:hypothetical protein
VKSNTARSFVAAALVTSLGSVLPVSAFADTTTSTIPSTNLATSPLRAYGAAVKVYNAKLKAIDVSFVSTVRSAKKTYNLVMANATSSSQRITARSVMRVAITEATVVRDAALKALGKPPTARDKSHKDSRSSRTKRRQ